MYTAAVSKKYKGPHKPQQCLIALLPPELMAQFAVRDALDGWKVIFEHGLSESHAGPRSGTFEAVLGLVVG